MASWSALLEGLGDATGLGVAGGVPDGVLAVTGGAQPTTQSIAAKHTTRRIAGGSLLWNGR